VIPTAGAGATPIGQERAYQHGALQFQMFGQLRTDFLNYVRGVELVRDGSRYHFNLAGTPQEFEDLSAYESRRVSDRFTPQMLTEYCSALGVDPWSDDFYPGPSALVVSQITAPPGALSFTIEEAQRWRPGSN
jgi:hypothetical protein